MQPEGVSQFKTIRRIAAKETTLFFSSPVAYLFLAAFAAVTLFVFFWGEAFFARNIADVRPLFEWMPILLIFLTATLSMRMWSEERRSGTIEHVLTQPVPLWHFVVGKFLSCLLLLTLALLLTLPLPFTVAHLGDLDWGPVLAGYLATFLLGAAYLSIGLFVSARSQNQIVSLIVSVAVCGGFYLLGSPMLTGLFGAQTADWMRLLGAGSRFEAITRGVIDLRDLYYYLGMVIVFLTLNIFVLESERWCKSKTSLHGNWRVITALVLANAVGANLWLGQLQRLRVDVTEGRLYSLSRASVDTLEQLREPLLLRGYFSSQTHPLLAPLAPQLKDLMKEYEAATGRPVRVEIIDPAEEPELEQEANQSFGIQPVPFQVADRHQAAIVSSYFHVLVKYGSEYEVLGFEELVEVKQNGPQQVEVRLRNPEYDLTRAIKKVQERYQGEGSIFELIDKELTLNAYVSQDSELPQKLQEAKNSLTEITEQLSQEAGGRFQVTWTDPAANDGEVAREIAQKYGFHPMSTGLLNGDSFYFYLTLTDGQQIFQVSLDDLKKTTLERNLEAVIKRFAKGFTRTVVLATPSGGNHSAVRKSLGGKYTLKTDNLKSGRVPGEADILVLIAPEKFDDKQLFAVDQFLMRGGTVLLATSPFKAEISQRSLEMNEHESGLESWLEHHGLTVEKKMVLDPQCMALPLPATRMVQGIPMREIRMLDYPYFVDMRAQELNQENLITSELKQVTLAWASPIKVDPEKTKDRQQVELLHSSQASWLSDSTQVMPPMFGQGGAFTPSGERGSQLLGVVSSGRFESYFAGKESPLLEDKSDNASGVIEHSADSARVILLSSNSFLDDIIINLMGSATGGNYLNSLQLLGNAVDWSLEDRSLLAIKSRGHFNRTLPTIERKTQLFWEYLNYGLALLAIAMVGGWRRYHDRKRRLAYARILGEEV